MVKIQTLNELPSLRDSGFGQPAPRHGLNLLYWFANEAVEFRGGKLIPIASIRQSEFGFEFFWNRIDDDDDERLLPDESRPYFEVGNLNREGAERLPRYVRPDNNKQYHGKANIDRIIVRLNGGAIDRIYITQHSDQKNFNHYGTYRVSLGLIQIIRNMERTWFLQQVRSQIQQQCRYVDPSEFNRSQGANENDSWFSWCTIL